MKFKVQESTHFNYWIAVFSTRTFYDLFCRIERYGEERVPNDEAYLLAGNHLSFIDPPAFGSSLNRDVFYFARKSLFRTKFSNWVLTSVNTIPVDRGGGDASAMKRVLGLLKKKQGVILFPEGTRSENGNPQPAEPGVGLMACKTHVKVVPAKIIGSFEIFGRHMKFFDFHYPLDVIFGQPMLPSEYDPGPSHPDRYQEAANRIMARINSLQVPYRQEI